MSDAKVLVSSHPLVMHKLTQLRDRNTEPFLFRTLVREVTQLLFYEASHDLSLQRCVVQTPLAEHTGHRVGDRIALMPILRAGLGMADAVVEMMPDVGVWHLGLYRDHDTLQPVTYYNKLPPAPSIDLCFVLDPMLATGGSARAAISILKQWGAKRIKFLGLIAAPEGVRAVAQEHPDVPLHLGAIDSHLDERSYIVPGLGDAGDRQFGT
jgi:uracil phosphoribosyltransferase